MPTIHFFFFVIYRRKVISRDLQRFNLCMNLCILCIHPYIFIYFSIHPCIYLSIYLSIYLLIHSPIQPFIIIFPSIYMHKSTVQLSTYIYLSLCILLFCLAIFNSFSLSIPWLQTHLGSGSVGSFCRAVSYISRNFLYFCKEKTVRYVPVIYSWPK